MGSGLPILCSSYGPMPEVLGDGGLYFDPLDVKSLEDAIMRIVSDIELQTLLSKKAYQRAQKYDWLVCANKTLDFLISLSASNAENVLRPK